MSLVQLSLKGWENVLFWTWEFWYFPDLSVVDIDTSSCFQTALLGKTCSAFTAPSRSAVYCGKCSAETWDEWTRTRTPKFARSCSVPLRRSRRLRVRGIARKCCSSSRSLPGRFSAATNSMNKNWSKHLPCASRFWKHLSRRRFNVLVRMNRPSTWKWLRLNEKTRREPAMNRRLRPLYWWISSRTRSWWSCFFVTEPRRWKTRSSSWLRVSWLSTSPTCCGLFCKRASLQSSQDFQSRSYTKSTAAPRRKYNSARRNAWRTFPRCSCWGFSTRFVRSRNWTRS